MATGDRDLRATLIAAAEEEIALVGIGAVSLRAIARRAGVSHRCSHGSVGTGGDTVKERKSPRSIRRGDSGGTDEFIARQAWLYVAIVASAYMISRGLAKSGSREPYYSDGTNSERGDRR